MTEQIMPDFNKKSVRKTIIQSLRDLDIGGFVSFPIDKVTSVRSLASLISLQLDRKYTTSSDRKTKTINVKRVS